MQCCRLMKDCCQMVCSEEGKFDSVNFGKAFESRNLRAKHMQKDTIQGVLLDATPHMNHGLETFDVGFDFERLPNDTLLSNVSVELQHGRVTLRKAEHTTRCVRRSTVASVSSASASMGSSRALFKPRMV